MMRASSRASARTRSIWYRRTMRRRRVDGVHDVVERAGEGEDVLAIERRHERAVQPLDDLVRQEVALVLDLLDFVRLVPDRLFRSQHFDEQNGAAPCFFRQGHEVIIKALFARYQSESHLSPAGILADLSQTSPVRYHIVAQA